ncbi:conserved hypothetical protein [Crenothrix polyspora]|uniref:PhoD-like phosphatase metallophosphatase domain-containing protein n=1 Tax=Crenothrix polyspora TaxID=360316 RepID=A0A1R4H3A3_9GAMM|nr:hypothetical protein [Crenothrix polyspora]SJM90735.1 conserved hypothetical protein [Crenothrix polyspora]
MPELPIILAGPILRRVEPRLVAIWMAFSEPQHVELNLWSEVIKTQKTSDVYEPEIPPDYTFSINTDRIGTHFHIAYIALVIEAPKLPLVPNIIYSYNIRFTDRNLGELRDLKSLGLLADQTNPITSRFSNMAIGFKEGQFPSFSLCPTNLEDIVLIHGSCRKMHGIGKDGLAALDFLINSNILEPKKRPHQLFLTGDQIYADDVPMMVLPHLSVRGKALFGDLFEEKVMVTNSKTVNANLTNFPPNLRCTLMRESAKFSSEDNDNHLIAFHEFVAMYLFSFSNHLLPDELANLKDEISDAAIDLIFAGLMSAIDDSAVDMRDLLMNADEKEIFNHTSNEKRNRWEGKRKQRLKKEIKNVIEFRDNLPRIARILANVPVYMILDDHEITDDWYITKDWRDQVLSHPLGVNIIRNGLMAYTLFQAWGNDPLNFKTGDNAAIISKIQEFAGLGATEGPSLAIANSIDALLGFDGNTPKVKWHFNVPTGPTTTYFLDTRTRRVYETRHGSPGLMSPDALMEQLPNTPPPVGAEVVFIVSPAPVLGLAVFEELIQPLISSMASNVFADTEAWALNFAAFESFLARIEKYKRIVLLSGDVHFGLSTVLDYFKGASKTRVVQLVSSACKNESDKLGNQHILISGRLQQLQSAAYFPAERLGWMNKVVNVSGSISPRNEMRRHKNPVVLSPQGWFPGATASPAPDWSWRINILTDLRPDTDAPDSRPENIRIDTITPDIDFNSAVSLKDGYVKVVERHQQAFENNIARRVVWSSNIGRVQIKRESGKLSVEHQFWHRLPDDDLYAEPKCYTQHNASLEPTTDLPPTLS